MVEDGRRTRFGSAAVALVLTALGGALVAATQAPAAASDGPMPDEQVLRGRELVIQRGCGTCHGGGDDPSAEGWLAGVRSPAQEFPIGPCDGDGPCWMTRPRNLTPHNTTGLGRFSERQIFNALRYGLRPGETADVEITSGTPGEGNFPLSPKYLAPPMPWTAFRHMPDEDLWAIAAYLKRGVKPFENRVEDSEGPPDFWESAYAELPMGSFPPSPFPAAAERRPTEASVDMDRVLHGRALVVSIGCGDCHGGFSNPDADGFLAGVGAGPGSVPFPVGPCLEDPSAPCFMQIPRNLTPDPETGLGAFTERQIFNALRHGFRLASSPDAVASEDAAGDAVLGPGMPWIHVRHMSDEEVQAIATYLKHAVAPVRNVVPDSDRPPGGWGEFYGGPGVGTWPAPGYPTERETGS